MSSTIGKILGVVLTIDTLASVAGIVFLGQKSVADGSYIPAIQILIILCIVALVGVLLIKTNLKSPTAESS